MVAMAISPICSVVPIQAHNPNGISIGLAVFEEMTTACPYYTLEWDARSPLKIVPSHGGIWTPI